MKKQLLTFLLLISMNSITVAQTLWEENFESYAIDTGFFGLDGTPIGDYANGVTKWEIDASGADLEDSENDYVRVNSSGSTVHLEARDTDGEVDIIFQSVDISSESGDVTIRIDDLDFNMLINANIWFGAGYVDVDYSLDEGVTYTQVPNFNSEGNEDHTFFHETTTAGDRDINDIEINIPDSTIGTSNSIIVRISLSTKGSNQEIELDDVVIKRNGVQLFEEDFNSYAIPTGLVGTGSHLSEQGGDYPVSKWSLALNSPTQLLNRFDYAKVSSNSTNKTLLFNDINEEVTFETEAIDITGRSQITFAMDFTFEETEYESSDFLDIYYSIDNGSSYLLVQDNGSGHTFGTSNITAGTINFSKTLNNLTATQFKIKIVAKNDSNTEDFELDNIKVTAGSALSTTSEELVGVKMYPNPVRDNVINIVMPIKDDSLLVDIYDVTGKKVCTAKTINSRMSLPNIPKGIYIIRFTQGEKSNTKKLIIQ